MMKSVTKNRRAFPSVLVWLWIYGSTSFSAAADARYPGLLSPASPCYSALQEALNQRAEPSERITLKSAALAEGTTKVFEVYAWIEEKADPRAWPYHSTWEATVSETPGACEVTKLEFLYGNM